MRTVDEQLALILSGAVRPAPVRVPVAEAATAAGAAGAHPVGSVAAWKRQSPFSNFHH